jgi:hypothetical protein
MCGLLTDFSGHARELLGFNKYQMDLDQEEWRPLPEWESYYDVSSLGRVRRSLSAPHRVSTKPGRILNPDCATGYARVTISNGARKERLLIHRGVARAFLDGFIPGRQVNHIDGNKLNNRYVNLEWVTPRENVGHAWRTGLCQPLTRSEHGQSRLDEYSASAICYLYHVARVQQIHLAKAFGITGAAISSICARGK